MTLKQLHASMQQLIDWDRLKQYRQDWQNSWKYRNILKFTEEWNVIAMARVSFQLGLNVDQPLRTADLATGFGWLPLALQCLGHEALSLDGHEPGMREGSSCLKLQHATLHHKIREFQPLPNEFSDLDVVSMMGVNLRDSQGNPFTPEQYNFLFLDLKARLKPSGRVFIRLNPYGSSDKEFGGIWKKEFWDKSIKDTGFNMSFPNRCDVYLGEWKAIPDVKPHHLLWEAPIWANTNLASQCPSCFIVTDDPNYHHFMVESLLALHRELDKYDLLHSKDCTLYYSGRYYEIVKNYTKIVRPSIEAPANTHVIAKNGAICPSLKEVANHLLFEISLCEPDTITLISRIGNRQIENLNELQTLLTRSRLRIEEVELENTSFTNQILLFRRTKMLLGAHGAGFTNMMFMQANTYALELNPFGFLWEGYSYLASIFSINFREIEGIRPTPGMSNLLSRTEYELLPEEEALKCRGVARDVAKFLVNIQLVREQLLLWNIID